MNIDLPAYRLWLLDHASEVVGYAHNCDEDPLATFLSWKLGVPVGIGDTAFVVGSYSPRSRLAQQEFPLPTWAIDHVARIDALDRDHDPNDPTYTRAITGAEALSLLDAETPHE